MPAFDYKCDKCDITIEVTHGMLETKRIKCPKCNRRMQKLIGGGGGIIFRGHGWYKRDYSKDKRYREGK